MVSMREKTLFIGHYRIEEVTVPDGYVVNKNYVEITVDSDTAYEVDGVSGDVIIEVSYEDQPVKGNLIVYKKGEMLSGFENDFIYKEQYLSGAEFEVRAAEDICTPDHQKDADGNRIVLYAKDTLGTTIIPFKDKFDKSLKLYSLMTTKPEEVEQREKEGRTQ